MCGIVGFAGRETIDRAVLETMSATLVHRGPDDSGSWYSPDGTVGFAHRRLAIIDLSPGGHQPMSDLTAKLHLMFNGEIYNFLELRAELEGYGVQFRSRSDTEVLLLAYRHWGIDFVKRLNGMFVFALYDEERGELILARDRAGEKPLFCWRTGDRIVFASELKALFAFRDFPRRLNLEALEHYLAYGYVPGELCILDQVQKLAPGHIVRYRPATGEWCDKVYWSLPSYTPNNSTAEELEEEFETLLQDAVTKQLVADVPVAILLSGGIDSSLVTAMAARTRSRVKTFTVTFKGHGSFDESRYARLVASHFGTEHVEVEGRDMTVDLLPRLARQYDEPIADSSMVPTYVVSALIRQHATVALGGDGGDELFGGYPHYNLLQKLEQVRRHVPMPVRGIVSRTAQQMPLGVRGRAYLMGLGDNAQGSIASINLYFDHKSRRKLLRFSADGQRSPEENKSLLGAGAHSVLDAAQRADFLSYLTDNILVKVDRASMFASLETRAPFLDHRIIDFAFGRVPDSLKATTRDRKILLRRLATRLLPSQLDLHRKQGFSIPLKAWFRGEWGSFMRAVLADADERIFNRPMIERLVASQKHGFHNIHRLYALVIFELWRREYKVTP